ncbi:MAG: hypothetical protein EB143_07600, partial [Actinobacteria bacterium]|nr:hypothetical protein [Actinomycetota bacterium]
ADQSTLGDRPDTNGEPIVGCVSWLASIPSPSSGSLELGPLRLNAYGLMIALGAIAATWLMGRRLEARKWGTRDDASSIATWAVPAGVVGARIYHVITDWERFDGRLIDVFKIWKGGLGIYGGLVLGTAVGLWVAKNKGLSVGRTLTAAARSASGLRLNQWVSLVVFSAAVVMLFALRRRDTTDDTSARQD